MRTRSENLSCSVRCLAVRAGRLLLPFLVLFAAGLQVQAQRATDAPASPEAATALVARAAVIADRHLVVAANPYAAAAGRDMLRAGGSAVDAAIAAQLVLGLVEPQSSGLGGGGFLVAFDAASSAMRTYDGRESAPAAATPTRFIANGRPMPFDAASRSGLAVGTPGLVAMLGVAHQRHGRLPWARLFEPAIRIADEGFLVSPRLSALLHREGPERFPGEARRYFFDETGMPRPTGFRLKNPDYATTLRAIAAGGPRAFYEGPIAQTIANAVLAAPFARGDLTLVDLAGYRAIERAAVCAPYRGKRVCGMGAPSSGGLAIAQALMLLEGEPLGRAPADAMRPADMHLVTEATRLAFADRNFYVGDPARVSIPTGLLDPSYIAERRRLLDRYAPTPAPYPGIPPGAARIALGADATDEASGTTHVSIIDAAGNAVAMTTSIEQAFGSHLWASGFLLNNQLTDFSFRSADRDGRPIANRVEGGKRPRSSMAPTIVLDERGRPLVVTGSPGGPRIIAYVLKSLIATLDWRLSPQQSVELVNFGSRGGGLEIELPAASDATLGGLVTRSEHWHRALRYAIGLKAHGQSASFAEMASGLHMIARRPDGRLEAGVDPRREGAALGD